MTYGAHFWCKNVTWWTITSDTSSWSIFVIALRDFLKTLMWASRFVSDWYNRYGRGFIVGKGSSNYWSWGGIITHHGRKYLGCIHRGTPNHRLSFTPSSSSESLPPGLFLSGSLRRPITSLITISILWLMPWWSPPVSPECCPSVPFLIQVIRSSFWLFVFKWSNWWTMTSTIISYFDCY